MTPAHLGAADPRAYVRLAAMVREQITDGTLGPGLPVPSITRLSQKYGHARGLPAARRCACWNAKGS